MRPIWSHRTKVTVTAVTVTVLSRVLIFTALVAAALPIARMGIGLYVQGGVARPEADAEPAPYADLRIANASPMEAERIRSALASLKYRIDPNSVSVVVNDDWQLGGGGQAGEYDSTGKITLSRPVVDIGGTGLTWTLGHELGHHVDQNDMDDQGRAEFLTLRHIPLAYGWDAPLRPWPERPAEDFADTFAALSQQNAGTKTTTVYGPIQDPARIKALLAERGVVPGKPVQPESGLATWVRDVGLYKEFLRQPDVSKLLVIAAALFIGWGALSRGEKTWTTGAWR